MPIDFCRYLKPKDVSIHDFHKPWMSYYSAQVERFERGNLIIHDGAPWEVFDAEISYETHPRTNETIISTPVPPMLTKEDMKAISESLFEGL